jgi:Outer membrane protein beta-barrel domain
MKKVLFTAIVAAGLITSANAQKGSVLLYGEADVSTSKTAANVKSSSVIFAPGIGYQFNDNWTLGVAFGIGSVKEEIAAATGYYDKTSVISVGPFLRYTKPLNNLFSAYGQLDLDYISTKRTPFGGAETKEDGFQGTITPAIALNVKNGFGIYFNIGGISYQTTKVDGAAEEANQFDFTFGKTVGIGVSKNFGGRK